MRPILYKIIILTLTGLICFGIGYIFLHNSDPDEWYAISMLFLYDVGLVGLYLTILTVIGFITRFYNKIETSKSIFRATGISFFILLIFMSFSKYSMNKDFNEWKTQTDKERIEAEKLKNEYYQERFDSLTVVIESQPKNYEALVERGLMKRHKGQYEASIKDYRKALDINPQDFKANLEMGYSLGLIGKKKQQDSLYRVAARLDTNSYFAKRNPEYLK